MKKAFTLVEILVYITLLVVILLIVGSFVFWFIRSNNESKISREALSNAKRVLFAITSEVKEAESVYDPTTSSEQLSLETKKYLPEGEKRSFIDFYLCGNSVCMKKEGRDPFALTSESVEVTDLSFVKIVSGESVSVKINLTVNCQDSASVSLTSSASLRSY